MEAKYRFELKQSGPKAVKRQFWFRLICVSNGKIMFTGERHPTKAKVKRALLQCLNVIQSGDWEIYDVGR